MNSIIRILLVDDHYVVRIGLGAVLGKTPEFQIISEAADGEAAMIAYREHLPDLVLMDMRMPVCDGVKATKLILSEFPEARILMLTTYDGEEDIHRAMNAGACGYLMKTTPPEILAEGIRSVVAGNIYLPPAVRARLDERNPASALTAREIEVLTFVSKGLTNRDIANVLGLSENTAKWHLKNILRKMDVFDRTEATSAALQRGIIHLD